MRFPSWLIHPCLQTPLQSMGWFAPCLVPHPQQDSEQLQSCCDGRKMKLVPALALHPADLNIYFWMKRRPAFFCTGGTDSLWECWNLTVLSARDFHPITGSNWFHVMGTRVTSQKSSAADTPADGPRKRCAFTYTKQEIWRVKFDFIVCNPSHSFQVKYVAVSIFYHMQSSVAGY